MKRILIPALTTLVVVAGLIVVTGWNRSRPPLAALTLTERELQLPWNASREETPSLQLQFEFEERNNPLDARNWLPEDRLRALGFTIDTTLPAHEAERRVLPHIAWVVFEYGGPSWQDAERRRQMRQTAERSYVATESSRLVPIDASLDVDRLLTRYPSGHLIMRASITLDYRTSDHGGTLVYGRIERLHPSSVNVPLAFRDRIAGLSRRPIVRDTTGNTTPHQPRYEVEVAVGPLGVPYIRDLRRLAN